MALVVALLVGGSVAYFLVKGNEVSQKVFSRGGGVQALLHSAPLAEDENGRVNVLIFGTSQDDLAHSQGSGGQGLWLTDSIQLVSVDPDDRSAVMVAIPRDTWVELAEPCVVGYQAKINAVFECAAAGERGSEEYAPNFFSSPQEEVDNYAAREAAGAQALMDAVAEVTGIEPSYYAHVNYSVLRDSVDAVGGIEVEIVGSGHEGIFDTNLDYPCYQEELSCRKVYYPRDGDYELTGDMALNLARARGDGRSATNPYACMQFGLDRGDFDRAANQQKIMTALKDKAVSAGTLTNPLKVNGLLDALGANVITNLTASEGRTAMSLAQEMGEMTPISLVDPDEPMMQTGRESDQSVVLPIAGPQEWAAIHEYLQRRISEIANPRLKPSVSKKPRPNASISPSQGAPESSEDPPPSASPTPTAKPTEETPYTCAGYVPVPG